MEKLDEIAGCIKESNKVLGFTGAGVSTASGIPDFRSPDGFWAKNRTIMFDDFVANYEDRVEYWRQKAESWPQIRDSRPNIAHRFFYDLEKSGRLLAVITQNIDGLHEKSGISPDKIVRLHGWLNEAVCLSCRQTIAMDEACRRVREEFPAPVCRECGGLLKPATISFGQRLRPRDLERAAGLSAECDLFLAVGSSLVVQPAAGFPELAKKNGARLVIVNKTATPLDRLADVVVQADIGTVFSALADRLG